MGRLAYEPFGKRRFAAGTDDPNNSITPANTERGFTNHEHIDELGLMHMNGRVYDPTIGRFMSADFKIPDPSDLQSYNRYSYVFNRPLVLTDSDGHCGFICVAIWVAVTAEVAHQVGIIDTSTTRTIQGIAIGAALAPVSGGLSFAGGGFGQAMVAGFAGGFVGGNFNVEAGLYGAATAGLFYWAGQLAEVGL